MNQSTDWIVVVDDDQGIRESFAAILEETCHLDLIDNGEAAKRAIHDKHPRLLFLDLKMPGTNGLDVLNWLQESGIETTVVIISAVPKEHYPTLVNRSDVQAFLNKPLDTDTIQNFARMYNRCAVSCDPSPAHALAQSHPARMKDGT